MASVSKVFIWVIIFCIVANRNIFGDFGFLSFYAICVFLLVMDGLYKPLLKNIAWLVVPICWALFIGLVRHSLYDVFKDVYYFLSPVFVVLFGGIVAKRLSNEELKKVFVWVGIISSVVFIASSLWKMGITSFFAPRTSRDEGSMYVNSSIFLSLTVLIYDIVLKENRSKAMVICLLINLLAIWMSGSRTYWVAALVVALVIGYPWVKRHTIKTILLALCFALFGLYIVDVGHNNRTTVTLMKSVDEMEVRKYDSEEQRNNFYRGYEAWRAMQQYKSYDMLMQFTGAGLGEKVDIVDSPIGIRYVPILHNGYPYILVKTGFAGMCCYLIWAFLSVFLVRKNWNSESESNDMMGLCAVCGILVVLITHSSVNTIFNSSYNILLMLVGVYIYNLQYEEVQSGYNHSQL